MARRAAWGSVEEMVLVEGTDDWEAMHIIGYVSWYALPYDWELE